MADKPKSVLGPAGETVMQNVKRLREAQRLTFVELSSILGRLERPIPVLGLRRIERGERRVDADDLFALATAFDVSPLTLLLPWEEDPDAHVEVTDIGTVTARMIWQWALGIQPMATSTTDPEGEFQRFRLDSLPPFARFGSADVAVRKLAALEDMVYRLASHKVTDTPDPEAISAIINQSLLPNERLLDLAKLSSTAVGRRVAREEIERMNAPAEAFRESREGEEL